MPDDIAGKINGMRRAAQIFIGSAMMMDESPQEMVSRGQMAATLRDIAAELERQASLLEMDHPAKGAQQGNNGPEQDDGADKDPDEDVDQS